MPAFSSHPTLSPLVVSEQAKISRLTENQDDHLFCPACDRMLEKIERYVSGEICSPRISVRFQILQPGSGTQCTTCEFRYKRSS